MIGYMALFQVSPSVSIEVKMLSLTESFAWRILPIVSRFCNDYIPNAMTLLSPLIVLVKVENRGAQKKTKIEIQLARTIFPLCIP